ncbi:hypothetical protein ICE98_02858 [Lactococcus lactis]|nr:hypothetical protein [Lactococcus lactis]
MEIFMTFIVYSFIGWLWKPFIAHLKTGILFLEVFY